MIVTANDAIIDYVLMHCNELKLSNKEIKAMNQVRVFKKMHLPCDLVGFCGKRKMKTFREGMEKSVIKWKVDFIKVSKPTKKRLETWQEFIDWLSA